MGYPPACAAMMPGADGIIGICKGEVLPVVLPWAIGAMAMPLQQLIHLALRPVASAALHAVCSAGAACETHVLHSQEA